MATSVPAAATIGRKRHRLSRDSASGMPRVGENIRKQLDSAETEYRAAIGRPYPHLHAIELTVACRNSAPKVSIGSAIGEDTFEVGR